jgi:hypothetical protein
MIIFLVSFFCNQNFIIGIVLNLLHLYLMLIMELNYCLICNTKPTQFFVRNFSQ